MSSSLMVVRLPFTLSPDQKGIETDYGGGKRGETTFTLSPDQKGIETPADSCDSHVGRVHTEPRSKGD